MKRTSLLIGMWAATALLASSYARAGQAPGAASDPDVPVSHHDRVYAAEQFSNTVSVTDPADNKLLGVIRLGEPQPGNLSPLYRGQVLVHGIGYSPDHRTIAVVSIGTNSVTFIDTATNATKHVTYVGRAPHEAFFAPDGNELWVTVRGEDYVAVLDTHTFEEKARITVPAGPGMQIFSPDGMYGYVCSSFTPETVVVTVADHKIVGRVKQESPFCPNIAATPDGKQVWFTLKDTGRTQVFDARPPFALLKTLDTGPISNHVNLAHNANGTFAYITIGGLNEIKVFRVDNFEQVATIQVGKLPHGIWPSGDGTRVYVGLENSDALAAIDTLTNTMIATIPIGQAPQALAYIPNAVPDGDANSEPAAARRRGPGGPPVPRARQGRQRRQGDGPIADQRVAVRSGAYTGPGGGSDRLGSHASVCARARDEAGRHRSGRAARSLHDQSGGIGDRQRRRSNTSDRTECGQGAAPLSGDRSRRHREARRARASAG